MEANQREAVVEVVESYVRGLGSGDFSQVPFALDFTFESPLLAATVGEPRLVGQAAIDFLQSLSPIVKRTRVKQHIVTYRSP